MVHLDGGAVVLRWRRHPSCVGLARSELRKALAGWGLSALEDPAILVLSELVTNAVVHARVPAGREIETRFLPTGRPVPDGLRIEVHDASDRRPHVRTGYLDTCDGRGLVIVNTLADAWGVSDRVGVGKLVWALWRSASDGTEDGASNGV
ncbi:ATP-binding protein [Streptomyces sp. NPDC050433]|uniref:ATP-binding protein n=1 Tax=unclassified Streptomyces TaxID=2593676 RepID=UPI00343F5F25